MSPSDVDAMRAGAYQDRALVDRLGDLAMHAGVAPDLETLYGHLFAFARASSPSTAIVVSHYDREAGARTCVFGASVTAGAVVVHEVAELPVLPLSDSPGSEAIRTGRPIITKDYSSIQAVDVGDDLENVTGSALAVPMRVFNETIGVFELQCYAPDTYGDEHVAALSLAGNLAAVATRNIQLLAGLADAYESTIEGWARALDLKDHETVGHSRRVTDLTVRLAEMLGLPADEIEHVRRGALLHDIGKMGVPDAVLLKPGPLTEEEWVVMRSHTTHATELLAPIDFLRPALAIPTSHHERWDGSGYPAGLAGEAIPIGARIFAVVDVYDALTSARPYRAAWSRDRTLAHIRAEAGTHFDPAVAHAFLALVDA